jgi:hypothetical protein
MEVIKMDATKKAAPPAVDIEANDQTAIQGATGNAPAAAPGVKA